MDPEDATLKANVETLGGTNAKLATRSRSFFFEDGVL